MRRVLRALKALIAGGAALTLEAPALISPAAPGDVFDEIVIAHRSGAAAKFGEGTMLSYQDSVANHADILDGDINWTKDSRTIQTRWHHHHHPQRHPRPDHQLLGQSFRLAVDLDP